MPTISVKVVDLVGDPVEKAQVYVQDVAGPFNEKDGILRGVTDVFGSIEGHYSLSSDTEVVVRVRLHGFAPFEANVIPTDEAMPITVVLKRDLLMDDEFMDAVADARKAETLTPEKYASIVSQFSTKTNPGAKEDQ